MLIKAQTCNSVGLQIAVIFLILYLKKKFGNNKFAKVKMLLIDLEKRTPFMLPQG